MAAVDISADGSVTSELPEQQDGSDRGFFIWLSDIHMDPYYSSTSAVCARPGGAIPGGHALPIGTRGCDPPPELWVSAVAAAARFGQGADFVMTTGDFVRHKQHLLLHAWENVTSILNSSARILDLGFSGATRKMFIMGSQGNDDSPADYELNITTNRSTNPWLANAAASWQGAGVMTQKLGEKYSYGGFFEDEVGGLRVLSINTIVYSVAHRPPDPAPADPFGQFAWLRARLQQAAQDGRRVWIVGHIPPGIETYSYTPLWRDSYVAAYLSLVEDPVLGGAVAAQLFGHVHADEFRVLPRAPSGAGPVLLTGALSPIYNSNPSFRLVEYERSSGRLLNVKVYWAPMPTGGSSLDWRYGYDLLSLYPPLQKAVERSGALTNHAFVELAASLRRSWASGGEEFSQYAAWYKTQDQSDLLCCVFSSDSHPHLSNATKRRYMCKYFCGLKVSDSAAFDDCLAKHMVPPQSRPVWAVGSGDWETYWEARRVHWRSIAAEAEKPSWEMRCGHMLNESALSS